MKVLEKVPLYPFLIVVYPVLYLLAEFKTEIEPSTGLRSFLFLLIAAGLAFIVSLLIVRNPLRAGLVTLSTLLVFFLVFFVLYAPVYRALREVTLFGNILGRHRILIPLTAVVLIVTLVVSVILFRKLKLRILTHITQGVNLIAILLVLIPITSLIVYKVNEQISQKEGFENLPSIQQPLKVDSKNQPDIYYIILDMLTSDHILSKLMSYDDLSFSNRLVEIGFFIPECSRSNYPSTQYSITSSMNMDYLQALSESTEPMSFYPYMNASRLRRSLEDAGYQTFAFESGYSFTSLKDADHYYQPVESAWDLLIYPGITPFESAIMRVSGGQILYETRDQLSQKMQYVIDASYVQYRERIIYTFDTLAALPGEDTPKFVFAHILAPHDPFVFDADGSFTFRRTPFSLDGDMEFRGAYGWEEYSVAYVEELKYLHSVMLEIVEQIIEKSETPPVIVIHGDHGIPRSAEHSAQFEIYNAIYIQGRDLQGSYTTLTPVNTFRLVFNQVYGTSYPLLDDAYYLLDKTRKEFIPFTDPIPCP